jgi:hypothetical protein
MYSLSYISDAVGATGVEEEAEMVRAILRTSRLSNQANGITGLLAYAHGVFLQVIEGEEAVVEALFSRILTDPRHNNTQVLHRGEISERIYADWGMGSAFRLGTVSDHAARIAFLRSRFGKDRLASSADYFRYLLTPSRHNKLGRGGRVRRVGIFASSALWFTPVFNAIADVNSAKPTSVLVSDPDTVASGFPVDYVDIESNEGDAVRIIGFGKDLLRSPLISPFLKGIDLLVVLMRRSNTEANIEKLHMVLNLSEVQIAMPDVICITPSMDEKFSLELKSIGQSVGIDVETASASLLMGNDVLTIIKNWLVKNKLADRRDYSLGEIYDAITIPANALPVSANVTEMPQSPYVAPEVVTVSTIIATAEGAQVAEAPRQLFGNGAHQWQLLALNRIMSLPGAMHSLLINIDDKQVVVTHTNGLDIQTQQLMVSPIIDKFALINKIGLVDVVKEMVTTMTSCYEIVLHLTQAPQFALVVLFDRESTLLAALMAELRSIVDECEYLSSS